MAENRGTNEVSNQGNCSESYGAYLQRAAGACEAGDLVLGMHLYLAAYERAVADPDIPDGMALSGLREAWNLACDLKERSMAEYVFEKLEPFLTGDEIAQCANKLQNLALDRLEEYGFSREDLRDMAEMISQDFIGAEGSVVKVESISFPNVAAHLVAGAVETADGVQNVGAAESADAAQAADAAENGEVAAKLEARASGSSHIGEPPEKGKGRPEKVGLDSASADFNPYDQFNTSSVGTSYHAATNEGAGSYVFTRDADRATELERARVEHESEEAAPTAPSAVVAAAAEAAPTAAAEAAPTAQDVEAAPTVPADQSTEVVPATSVTQAAEGKGAVRALGKSGAGELPSMPQVPTPGSRPFNYHSLAGYSDAIASVRELGVGLERDGNFQNFIKMMNARHGLDRMPALDTLLFQSPVIEDATRFVDATIGEIGLPVLRLSMEEGFQGAPVLCVTTFGDSRPRMNHANNRFDAPAILVLDDLDTWVMPQVPENVEGIADFVMANMSRGAREAINMIRYAVEDPDVYVIATASTGAEPDPFFYEILEPISVIDIANPTDAERDEIWREIMHDHPSMRVLDRRALVRFSAGMPRYDLYMAARAAIEEAYKEGLSRRMYLPVSRQNIFDKIASYQPLDSEEYHALEDEIVRGFQSELEDIENLLGGAPE